MTKSSEPKKDRVRAQEGFPRKEKEKATMQTNGWAGLQTDCGTDQVPDWMKTSREISAQGLYYPQSTALAAAWHCADCLWTKPESQLCSCLVCSTEPSRVVPFVRFLQHNTSLLFSVCFEYERPAVRQLNYEAVSRCWARPGTVTAQSQQ